MIRTSALFLTLAISAFAADEPAKSPAPKPDSAPAPAEAPKNVMPQGLKNPFAAKPMIVKFTPTQIRANYELPPPPPPPLEDV